VDGGSSLAQKGKTAISRATTKVALSSAPASSTSVASLLWRALEGGAFFCLAYISACSYPAPSSRFALDILLCLVIWSIAELNQASRVIHVKREGLHHKKTPERTSSLATTQHTTSRRFKAHSVSSATICTALNLLRNMRGAIRIRLSLNGNRNTLRQPLHTTQTHTDL
jgi:hypothetical protein